jgi:hypothetical protein
MKRAGVRSALLAGLLAWAVPGAADEFEVAVTEAGPPDEVSSEIGEAVGAGSLVVSSGGDVVAELWLREDPPLLDPPDEVLEVSFGGLEETQLVGVIRVAREWREYKGLAVAPGVYTLRYGRRPADGNHMGVSMYRDFLLLTPAAGDTAVEVEWRVDEFHSRSMAATGQPHPASLALFPVWEEIAEPRILENDVGQPMLGVPLGPFAIGLTVEGQGEH